MLLPSMRHLTTFARVELSSCFILTIMLERACIVNSKVISFAFLSPVSGDASITYGQQNKSIVYSDLYCYYLPVIHPPSPSGVILPTLVAGLEQLGYRGARLEKNYSFPDWFAGQQIRTLSAAAFAQTPVSFEPA